LEEKRCRRLGKARNPFRLKDGRTALRSWGGRGGKGGGSTRLIWGKGKGGPSQKFQWGRLRGKPALWGEGRMVHILVRGATKEENLGRRVIRGGGKTMEE